jgi:hypothetical protein
METIKNNLLPRNWKKQVAETLAKKGFNLTETEVYNLAKGRVKNPTLSINVLETLNILKEDHQKKLDEIERLRKAVAI